MAPRVVFTLSFQNESTDTPMDQILRPISTSPKSFLSDRVSYHPEASSKSRSTYFAKANVGIIHPSA